MSPSFLSPRVPPAGSPIPLGRILDHTLDSAQGDQILDTMVWAVICPCGVLEHILDAAQ